METNRDDIGGMIKKELRRTEWIDGQQSTDSSNPDFLTEAPIIRPRPQLGANLAQVAGSAAAGRSPMPRGSNENKNGKIRRVISLSGAAAAFPGCGRYYDVAFLAPTGQEVAIGNWR